ncbi:hypothetical protein J2Y45_000506 [Dyadobacter sp. BE34]|uniref:DUF3823 domain-containing protein n=1 Tax=Dyadobacter fermentans TaxID=94254 RepID=A0ABU1QQ17_9BACT|nr:MULTISPECIES: DUF3823 domain-containing protein [Dyadobacter]MDR6803236.1 hypothetical protein [Dyadobacter fermentans]MDR7040977.1 hypothetical protein [Dyadobacter sp. BE242]MDR7195380.1 hypothetical protein [Dyadobacter sp. BE34]MDR7214075.1 hypothetical protein [Dyadobacter sp. BE31]MDR7260787.1 hypothetical protein [Dyadobacter sp. BE32]
MKSRIIHSIPALLLALVTALSGCEKDNRTEPESVLKGKVVFEGQPIGLRSNGVQLELWQHGYQLFTKIPVMVAQDGTFSASLFDGNYKLVRLRGNGPWVDNTDSIDVELRGSKEIDVPVNPFFILKNDVYSKGEGKVSATFNVQQVTAGRTIERVNLYIGTTTIVDPGNNVGNAQEVAANITDLSKPITLTANIPANLASREYIYARIGVKTSGVGEMLFGMPQKVMLR